MRAPLNLVGRNGAACVSPAGAENRKHPLMAVSIAGRSASGNSGELVDGGKNRHVCLPSPKRPCPRAFLRLAHSAGVSCANTPRCSPPATATAGPERTARASRRRDCLTPLRTAPRCLIERARAQSGRRRTISTAREFALGADAAESAARDARVQLAEVQQLVEVQGAACAAALQHTRHECRRAALSGPSSQHFKGTHVHSCGSNEAQPV